MIELSIIIPTLNEEDYLPYLLNSIKNQDYTNYEIIIADNNSKDKTKEITKKYGCKIIKGGLPGKARNNGAKVANGKYLLFLDADMILPKKDTISYIINKFKKKNMECISFNISPIPNEFIYNILFNLSNIFMYIFQFLNPIGNGCILTKKESHKKIKGFNEEIIMGEDWDYIKKMNRIGKTRLFFKPKIPTSTRRFKVEGILKISFKYIKSSIGLLLNKNLKKWGLNYDYNHYNKEK